MIVTPLRVALLLCLASATLALAHEGATGVVKERMDLMESQKDAMKLIGDMAKGKTPFDAAKAAEAARDISVTAKKIPELFPEGSGGDKSEALPAVWGRGAALPPTPTTSKAPPTRSPRRSMEAQSGLEARVSEGERRLQVLPSGFSRQEEGPCKALTPSLRGTGAA
jgi:cytochrome c556